MSLTTTFVPVATRNVSIFIALWLASAVCFIEPASAEILPTLFLRELVAKSEEIVVARPADAARLVGQDVKFVASEVLKGRRIVVGQTITVAHLSYYHLDDPPLGPRNKKGRPPQCVRALLFLNPKRTGRAQRAVAGQFELYTSGIRLLTDDAKVLLPTQFINPGDYYFVVAGNTEWPGLLKQVRADIKAVAAVFALRDIADAAERNRALFAWIEGHRKEFTGTSFAGNIQAPEQGWGSLEYHLFEWIVDGGRPDDAWRAVKVWRKVAKHPFGIGPIGKPDAFASTAGRRILFRVALDEAEPIEDRQSAVYRLAMSLYNKPPEPRSMTAEEYRQIKAATLALLEHSDPQLRRFTTWLAQRLDAVKPDLHIDPRPRETLDAVIEAYRRQPPGHGRVEMAARLIDMGGEYVWQQISGNPDKILVDLQGARIRRDERGAVVRFTIFQSIHHGRGDLFTASKPVAAMEKLDTDGTGERHVLPLFYLANASSGGNGPWIAEVPAERLSPGKWQLIVVGKVDAVDDYEWCSEPAVVNVD
jgi:hypothetical protein